MGAVSKNNIMSKTTLVILTAPTLACGTTTIIDFDSIAYQGTTGLTEVASSYSEDGFTLTNAGNFYMGNPTGSPFTGRDTGTKALFQRSTNTFNILTKDDGDRFSADSITLWESSQGFLRNASVTFIGDFNTGPSVQQTFVTNRIWDGEVFQFDSSFKDITALRWTMDSSGNEYHQFDNITLNAVPEPSATLLSLMAIGLSGLRRKR